MSSILTLILGGLLPALLAAASRSPLISPLEACKSVDHPDICEALLLQAKFPSTLFDYGHYSVKRASQQANRTAAFLYRYVVATGGDPSRRADDDVPRSATEICHSLGGLSADYIASVNSELHRGEAALGAAAVARLRSLMNAVVTNQHTCSDMLDEEKGAAFPVQLRHGLAYGTRLYSVSLKLVTAALKRTAGGADFVGHVEHLPIKKKLTVSKDGRGQYTKIRDAVKAATSDSSTDSDDDGYILIKIGKGIYKENIVVTKSKHTKLMFIGAGINKTVLSSSRSYADGYKTYDTGAFAVDGMEEVIVRDITFQNTAGPAKKQAVAVRASGDLAVFYRCSFLGYQDTLYPHSGRQFYRECDIYGTIDFICGNAIAVMQNCNIYARRPNHGEYNVVTAQARTKDTPDTGFSIHNCTIQAAPDLEAAAEENGTATRTFLGRPWEKYSLTVVMQSYIAGIVDKEGWVAWDGGRGLKTLYYGEYDNRGPGADTSGRVKWPGYKLMDAKAAARFTVDNFLRATAWLSAISIPDNPNLILD